MNRMRCGLIGIMFAAVAAAQSPQEAVALNNRGNESLERQNYVVA